MPLNASDAGATVSGASDAAGDGDALGDGDSGRGGDDAAAVAVPEGAGNGADEETALGAGDGGMPFTVTEKAVDRPMPSATVIVALPSPTATTVNDAFPSSACTTRDVDELASVAGVTVATDVFEDTAL